MMFSLMQDQPLLGGMHSLFLADTNWTVGGHACQWAGQPQKNHCCNLRQVYGLMQCVGTYIAIAHYIINTRFDDINFYGLRS